MIDPVGIGLAVAALSVLLLLVLAAARVARDIRDDYRGHRRALGEADWPVGGPVCPGRGSETVSLAECTPRGFVLADRRRSCA